MIIFKKILISLGSEPILKDALWTETINFECDAHLQSIFKLVLSEQECTKAKFGVEVMERKTLDDIKRCSFLINKYPDGSKEQLFIAALQTHLTLVPMTHFVFERQLVKALGWIIYGLGESWDFPVEQEFSINESMGSNYASHSHLHPEAVSSWFGYFYYTWRAHGCDYAIGDSLVKAAIHSMDTLLDNETSMLLWAENFGYLVCWLANHEHPLTKTAVSYLETFINNESIDCDVQIMILETLVTNAGRFSSKSSHAWATIACLKYLNNMSCDQRWMFSAAAIDENELLSFEIFYNTFKSAFQTSIYNITSDCVNLIHVKNRASKYSEIINPLIGKLIQLKYGWAALEVMHIWHGGDFYFDGTILVLSNHRNFLLLCTNETAFNIKKDNEEKLHAILIDTMSKFNGISCSINNNKNYVPYKPMPGRFGVPAEKFSFQYEQALVDYYLIDQWGVPKEGGSLMLSPFENHPVQFIQKKYKNICLPYNVSLRQKKIDRKIRKIAIFSGANSLTENLEIELLDSIFNQEPERIEITLFRDELATKNNFIATYESNEIDVIWVMSHGNFDHWEPESVSITLSGGELTMEDITSLAAEFSNRRLLFLNVCDGGACRSTGSVASVGMAPIAATPSQCVISHLWPVMPYTALIFSGCLAINLMRENGFFDAYERSLQDMIDGKDHIIRKIENTIGSLHPALDRIRNSNISTEVLAHGGSAAFFE